MSRRERTLRKKRRVILKKLNEETRKITKKIMKEQKEHGSGTRKKNRRSN